MNEQWFLVKVSEGSDSWFELARGTAQRVTEQLESQNGPRMQAGQQRREHNVYPLDTKTIYPWAPDGAAVPDPIASVPVDRTSDTADHDDLIDQMRGTEVAPAVTSRRGRSHGS